jgi:hypothetical protein
LQAFDICQGQARQPRLGDVFEACFAAGDVLFDLFDEAQRLGERRQTRIRHAQRRIEDCGAGGDEHGVEPVVLGAPQRQPGIGLDLQRLQHQDGAAGRAHLPDHASLIASGSLDADAFDAGLGQCCGQAAPAGATVLDGKVRGQSMDRDIELVLGGVDAGGGCGMICHFLDPAL